MTRNKVFATRRVPQAALDAIAAECDLDVWPEQLPPSPDVLRQKVADCDGLLSLLTDKIDDALLAAAPKLRVVSNFAVGVNNIDLPACTRRGVLVGNTPGVLTEATADITLTLMLAAARRLKECIDDARSGKWLTWEPLGWVGREMTGRTLGIVGMGRIGAAVARRCRFGWNMDVVYTSRSPKPDIDRELGATRVGFDELLGRSDFVSVHADLNPETQGMFGDAQFRKMKRSAVFVNAARGGHVDQAALANALRTGTIFAAGLDVTDPEPLPPSHELYSLPNCTIVPHVASATEPTREAIAEMCAANLLGGLFGRPMPSCLNPDARPQ